MTDVETGLRDIAEIRSLMERSTKFLSLSGFSGIGVGSVALVGAWFTQQSLAGHGLSLDQTYDGMDPSARHSLLVIGLATLVAAVGIAAFFSRSVLHRRGEKVDTQVMRYFVLALALPLIAGGSIIMLALFKGILWLIAPLTLIFYGLGLFSAGTFTFGEVRSAGLIQVVLGLAAAVAPAYGLYFWAGGFGLVHIVYGVIFFRKYRQ